MITQKDLRDEIKRSIDNYHSLLKKREPYIPMMLSFAMYVRGEEVKERCILDADRIKDYYKLAQEILKQHIKVESLVSLYKDYFSEDEQRIKLDEGLLIQLEESRKIG
jgi:hypothetical protein